MINNKAKILDLTGIKHPVIIIATLLGSNRKNQRVTQYCAVKVQSNHKNPLEVDLD